MNVLILTGRFGMGHIKAAEAIREAIQASDPQVHVNIVDFTEYLFPRLSDHIYKSFDFLVNRCRKLYNHCNRAADRYGQAPFQSMLLQKTDRLLASCKPDLVIATLPFCGQYISRWKKARNSSLPLYTYITDVTLHEEWISSGTDLYFAAAEKTREALLSRGIPPGKIVVSGVPVRQRFYSAGAPHQGPLHVLIMGGGLGMIFCSKSLLDQLHRDPLILTTIVTGKNTHLARKLRDNYPDFHILGYTEEIHHYMKKADLLITKPGGVTTFEAIASRTPLFLLPPELEQEKNNAQFVVEKGLGLVLTPDSCLPSGLIANRHLLNSMRRNMTKLADSLESTCPLPYFYEKNN